MFDILRTVLVFNEVKGCHKVSFSFLVERQKEKLVLWKNTVCFSQHDLFVFKSEPCIIFILALLKCEGRGYSVSRICLQAHSGAKKPYL